jgi:L-alanine-DL-glutamate epimerase-like enolase superfamily enzyme
LSWTLDLHTVSEVEPAIEAAWVRGFRNFNLKVGKNPSLDVMVCREIRRLAPDAFLWVDANGGYDLEGAMAAAGPLAECGVAALEQPFPANRLSWYSRLRQQRVLPILMDEGVVSLVDLVEFHQLGLLDGVAMKVARCGGLTEAFRIACYLEDNGLLLYASGTPIFRWRPVCCCLAPVT